MRHADPAAAIATYLDAIRRAETAGVKPPPATLNAIGDAYVDAGDLSSAAERHLQAAETYAADGLYENAIACCRKVLRRSAAHARAGLLLGRYAAAKGLVAEALGVLGSLAEEHQRAGRRREAIQALEELVRLAPGEARSRERLARLLQDEGRWDEARREYRAALELCLERGDPSGAEHVRARIAALEEGGLAEIPLAPESGAGPSP